MSSIGITNFFHSRVFTVLALLLMVSAAVVCYNYGGLELSVGSKGLVFPAAIDWFGDRLAGLCASLGVNLFICGMMIWLNRSYNFINAMSLLYVGLYAFMQTGTPDLLETFYGGSLLCAVVLFCTSLLFNSYGQPQPQAMRKVFMIFFLLSAMTATQYAYVAYMPLFLLGCIQMRIFSLRCIAAAVTGVATPWILMTGSGLVSTAEIHVPEFSSIFTALDIHETLALSVSLLLTVLLLISGMTLNFFKMLTYNARRRSFNGFISLLSAFTVVAMLIDYTNLITYIPMLNVCAAYSVAHFFVLHKSDRSYIAISTIICLYIALFIWKIAI